MSDTLEIDDNEDIVDLSTDSEEVGDDRGDVVEPTEAAEPETPAAEESGEAETKPAKSQSVPHARFHEVNEAKKEAERRNAELEAELERLRSQAPAPAETKQAARDPEFDFDAKEQEAADALFAGDTAAYKRIQGEIRTHERQEATQIALQQFEQITAQRTAVSLLQSTADRIAADYPFLNSESDEADAAAIKDVVEWRDFYMAKGDAPHKALEKAAKKVAPLYVADEQEKDGPPAPKVDGRRAAAVARAAASSAAQPPAGGGIGERAAAGKLDVEKLTDEQYAKLSDEEKRRLRGD